MRLCVRAFTLLNINISETSGPIATKFYLKHHWGGGKAASGFRPDRIGTLVSMATDSSHRVIMGKIFPYLKSPHHTCGTPHNICGTPQVHVEFLRNRCGIPQCFAELRKGFTTCGICSTSHIGIFSASIWKICGKFRLSFFT